MLGVKLYLMYKNRIFPKISNFKGSNKVTDLLARTVDVDLETIREEETDNFLEEEWDNLIVLDACRYDFYREITGCENSKISVGSHSRQFIENTFTGESLKDTVYVSANPHTSKNVFANLTGQKPKSVFYEIYQTHETDWDEEKGTVMPEKVVRDAVSAEKIFPNKRKIIHFMQPHSPFIGALKENEGSLETDSCLYSELYSNAEMGNVGRNKVRSLYRKNLKYVLNYVENLNKKLEGKTVVTSDHGELLGENGVFDHPYDLKARKVREVPWHVLSEN